MNPLEQTPACELDRDNLVNKLSPIEAGWQALVRVLPDDLSPSTLEVLRFTFFAGARHYRMIVKEVFELEDGDARYQTFVDIAVEINRWEREDVTPDGWIK